MADDVKDPKTPTSTTLDDDDIVSTRTVSRRSFLSRTGVTAGVAATGGAALSRSAAASDPIGEGSDTDPNDPWGEGSDADPNDPWGEGTDFD